MTPRVLPLSHEQTRYIFETNTIGVEDNAVKVDDIVETANHFKCIDMVIENANYKPSERFIKELHGVLKNGTSDSRKAWFAVGDYKRQANEVGGHHTTSPEHVAAKMKELITKYNHKDKHTFEELLDFHYQFEAIHPHQLYQTFESKSHPTFYCCWRLSFVHIWSERVSLLLAVL